MNNLIYQPIEVPQSAIKSADIEVSLEIAPKIYVYYTEYKMMPNWWHRLWQYLLLGWKWKVHKNKK